MKQKRIEEIRKREIETPPGPWIDRQDVPDLLDALEEAQEMLTGMHTGSTELLDGLYKALGEIERLQSENERLRAALRLAEQKCRRLVGTKTADHHIAILEECKACGAQFSSAVPTREQSHNDGCPFKILEEK